MSEFQPRASFMSVHACLVFVFAFKQSTIAFPRWANLFTIVLSAVGM